MKQEIKEKWVAALRSGEYKQGTEYLNRNGNFCCFGVLTDLYIQEKGLEWEDNWMGGKAMAFLGEGELPPVDVLRWAGMNNIESVELDQFGNRVKYHLLNDTYQYTFDQIADIIEKEEVT
jgi:hypothetical protein